MTYLTLLQLSGTLYLPKVNGAVSVIYNTKNYRTVAFEAVLFFKQNLLFKECQHKSKSCI